MPWSMKQRNVPSRFFLEWSSTLINWCLFWLSWRAPASIETEISLTQDSPPDSEVPLSTVRLPFDSEVPFWQQAAFRERGSVWIARILPNTRAPFKQQGAFQTARLSCSFRTAELPSDNISLQTVRQRLPSDSEAPFRGSLRTARLLSYSTVGLHSNNRLFWENEPLYTQIYKEQWASPTYKTWNWTRTTSFLLPYCWLGDWVAFPVY